ncbi:ATP synthase subunit delta, mitochondrial-like [Saccostrea echinata]|uniref:ATP synthase subunit delta, mitochondrial-like n=1 Tax=Saccostrea echinata TaxID=191078 RepID=UPI002A811704|nr:ATP synthase subunit delta, mitochondrial-like [Saccostrea echinata]XP_061192458.1 ATP synthase subunit delta, mitochondrial-like [Saccostrea echinata]
MASLIRRSARIPSLIGQCCRVSTLQNQQKRGYADASSLTFTMASPNKVFFKDEAVRQVNVPTTNGVFGILPQHVPTLAVLQPGVVTVVVNDSDTRNIFASSGSLTVNPDGSVHVLAEEACELSDLDPSEARDAMHKAQTARDAAVEAVDKAEFQIEVDAYEAILKSAESKS